MKKGFTVVACPICAKPVEWRPENAWRPFCSERCKQIDLGAWASGSYSIAGGDLDPDAADGSDAVGAGESR